MIKLKLIMGKVNIMHSTILVVFFLISWLYFIKEIKKKQMNKRDSLINNNYRKIKSSEHKNIHSPDK